MALVDAANNGVKPALAAELDLQNDAIPAFALSDIRAVA